jgi:DNA replication and repair protein RecF
LRIEAVGLRNFRNYKSLDLRFDRNINIFLGANAQGKTNLLEALTFLAAARSFRTRNESEMVLWGEPFCFTSGKVVHRYGESILKVTYNAEAKKKTFNINGKEVNKAAFLHKFTTVVFTPEDLDLVKGAPQQRRRFIDEEICKVSPVYENRLSRYQQVVRQRNYLLRMHRQKALDSDELAGWNEQLAQLAAAIMVERMSVVRRLGLLARLIHRRLTAREESLDIYYRTTLPVDEETAESDIITAVFEAMQQNRENEARHGQTLVGPHRDDLMMKLNGREARLFASQGQQRTLVLALKMAELEFIKGEKGEFPVLLFDDVFSELDQKRRELLLDTIDGRVQTFITGTEMGKIGNMKAACSVFSVSGGEVKIIEQRP